MAENAETQIIKIASPGDVILVVGTSTQLKLKVTSATLAGASKVFAALLGPNFSEGQDAGTAMQPKEIKLPDDDTTAMSDMCHLLHSKSAEALLHTPGTTRILSFAIVVDKYDCADTLRLQSQGILLGDLLDNSTSNMNVLGKQMASAYLLDNARAFQMVTRLLIESTTDELTELLEKSWANLIAGNIIYALEKKRATAQQQVIFDLPQVGFPKCENCDNYDPAVIISLASAFDARHWPPSCKPGGNMTIGRCLEYLNNLPSMSRIESCKHTRKWTTIYSWEFKAFAMRLKARCAGLCLGCVKEGYADPTGKCTNDNHF